MLCCRLNLILLKIRVMSCWKIFEYIFNVSFVSNLIYNYGGKFVIVIKLCALQDVVHLTSEVYVIHYRNSDKNKNPLWIFFEIVKDKISKAEWEYYRHVQSISKLSLILSRKVLLHDNLRWVNWSFFCMGFGFPEETKIRVIK